VPAAARGQEVAIVGGGLAGLIAGYELMKMGL
jgi:monoamine oxidase